MIQGLNNILIQPRILSPLGQINHSALLYLQTAFSLVPDTCTKEVKWECLALGIHAKASDVFILLVPVVRGAELNSIFQCPVWLGMTIEYGQRRYNYFWAWLVKKPA